MEAFDSHDFAANNKILHRAAQDLTGLQNDMLIQRIRQREHLQRTARRKHLNRPTDGLLSSDDSNSGVKSRRDSTKERHNHTQGVLAKDTALVGSRPQELASYLELEWRPFKNIPRNIVAQPEGSANFIWPSRSRHKCAHCMMLLNFDNEK